MKYNLVFAVALSAFSPISVSAEANSPSCILPESSNTFLSRNEWARMRLQLEPQLERCLDDPHYFALYGASLLHTGSTDSALEMLERALLIDPMNGSAQIDYAQALFQNGQLIAALQVNQATLDREALPSDIKSFLEDRKKSWDAYRFQSRHQVTYLGGHSNNLNNATLDREHVLTGGEYNSDAIWLLTDDEIAKGGNYNYVALNSSFYELTDEGTNAFSIDLKSRISSLREYDTDEFSVEYESESEQRQSRNSWNTSLEHIQLGGKGLYTSIGTGFESYFTSYAATTPYLKTSLHYAGFHSNSQFNEVVGSVSAGVSNKSPINRLGLEIEYKYNHSSNNRTGGDKQILEGQVYWDASVLRGRLISRLGYSTSEDKKGYSGLFKNGEARHVYTKNLSIQYFYSIMPQLIIHGGIYYKDQNSNLSIFETKSRNVDIGLTYRFQ